MRQARAARIVLLLCAGCAAEGNRDNGPMAPAAVVSVGEVPAVTMRAGESTTIAVPVVVAEGFHVQSNPAATEFLIPLELQVERSDGLVLGSPAYPPGRRHRLTGTDRDLLTYEGTVLIRLPVAVPVSGSPGAKTVRGSVRYQACDSGTCYFPGSVPVELTVDVSG